MIQLFVYPSIVFWSYTALQYQNSRSSNVRVFHTSDDISSRPAAFLFLIFVRTTSRSSCVNCPSLRSSWSLMIFVIGSFVTLKGSPRRFVKWSLHECICSYLAAFSLTLEVLFLLLTSYTVCHAIRYCLSSTEFLILLIWSWMYSVCSFRHVLDSLVRAFTNWDLLDPFFFLHRDSAFTLLFFLNR